MSRRFEDWEIVEEPVLGMFITKVWLIKREGNKTLIAKFVGGEIELTEIKENGTEPPPTLKINYDIWEMIKKSLIDEKVRDKNEVESELGATKYHLEDLRRLLKLRTVDKVK